jgi:hypothetical protein
MLLLLIAILPAPTAATNGSMLTWEQVEACSCWWVGLHILAAQHSTSQRGVGQQADLVAPAGTTKQHNMSCNTSQTLLSSSNRLTVEVAFAHQACSLLLHVVSKFKSIPT